MSYLALKYVHMSFALLSGVLFTVRGLWMMQRSPFADRRSVRLTSHTVDTTLLASALGLMAWSHQFPFVQDWLTAKLLALVAYIAIGSIALKRGKTRSTRTVAYLGALLLFAYILKLALTKQVF